MPTHALNHDNLLLIKNKFTWYILLLTSTLYLQPLYAGSTSIQAEKVLSVVTADWNDDGAFDRAVLIESTTETDQADLLIYLSDAAGMMRLAINKKDIAWRGAMWGTQPSLEIPLQSSLTIISANDAIGRNHWNLKLTVAYRNNTFVVAGYTYSERDTLAPNYASSCDVNFLNGKGVHNNKTITIATKPVALIDWSETSTPKECH